MKITTHTSPSKTWRLTNSGRKCQMKPKFPLKINVWGAINCTGRTNLYFFQESMNGDLYRTIIKYKLHPFIKENFTKKKVQFYSDNDPKHKARDTLDLLKSLKIQRMDWPSNSPDLNPIENIWAIIKREISKKIFHKISYLKKQVKQVLENIDQKAIRDTILTWQDRCDQIIKNNGETINY